MRRIASVAVVTFLLLAGCAQDEPALEESGPAAAPEASVTAKDYSFEAPEELSSGATEIAFSNEGKEPHQAQLVKLDEGTTVGDLVDAAKDRNVIDPIVGRAEYAGGPNGVGPGADGTTVADLEPGNYAFICLIPDAKGRSHLSLGMVSAVEVTEEDEPADLPETDNEVTATEFEFDLPESVEGSITFTNDGEQPHEFQVLGIAPGKTAKDVVASFRSEEGGGGPPPWTAEDGVAVLEPGQTGTYESNLRPGTYFAMCFVADPEEKAPHFALGMMQEFKVE